MFKCSVCGKEFESGATIRGTRVFCPECEDEYTDLLNEVVFNSLKKPGQEIEEIDTLVDNNKAKFDKFKIPISSIKMEAAGMVMRFRR